MKSLFQKSPLKNRAVHCATIYDISPSITTVYVPKSRHSRENGNLEAGVPVGFELMKQALETRHYDLNLRCLLGAFWPHITRRSGPRKELAEDIVNYVGPVPGGDVAGVVYQV